MILKVLVLKKFEFVNKVVYIVSANRLNELKYRALSKFVIVVMFFVYIINTNVSNHMIFLVQFGINIKHNAHL